MVMRALLLQRLLLATPASAVVILRAPPPEGATTLKSSLAAAAAEVATEVRKEFGFAADGEDESEDESEVEGDGEEAGSADVDGVVESNVTTVWIPSWPRAGSTTIFHMVMAAALAGSPAPAPLSSSLVERPQPHSADEVPPDTITFAASERDFEQACLDYTYSRGCDWTWDYSCPAQPKGRLGFAGDDFAEHKPGSTGYSCCCERGLWRVGHGSHFHSHKRYSVRHFGLFEPCHTKLGPNTWEDDIESELKGNCALEMQRLVHCNFTGMTNLWGWGRPHSYVPGFSNRGQKAPDFSQKLAEDACRSSNLVVYKTIDEFGQKLDDVLAFLEEQPHVRAVIPVRDPRAIYASWKGLPWKFEGVSLLGRICKQQAEFLDKGDSNPRLRRVVMERLVEQPEDVMNSTLQFLGFSFGKPQQRWIEETFNATCEFAENKTSRFRTCHGEVEDPLKRWKKVANAQERAYFSSNADCQKVAQGYGYEL
eukprot:TRINITY_DN55455_c0_g1_i1.p1 TRINITY_DN55455_c0_g1~~TRINITY_DN55455_c0_g1_i1.p1  ORF type:complete len:481 (+),score=103.66 TRINITY_DN55455_c0_g1_i1:191-1633(+)